MMQTERTVMFPGEKSEEYQPIISHVKTKNRRIQVSNDFREQSINEDRQRMFAQQDALREENYRLKMNAS